MSSTGALLVPDGSGIRRVPSGTYNPLQQGEAKQGFIYLWVRLSTRRKAPMLAGSGERSGPLHRCAVVQRVATTAAADGLSKHRCSGRPPREDFV
ncbi:hypothetical protein ZHAS_00017471 [Anopheles sinensis]|uniref:Uncharacterized protein n=1 Tax=Anopheles sinensis TaxID=74873 RepID=A0A084WGM9_ANOSI|nr:hypothetical protein ZHAS_00017471 [Anopheles sinensis]